MEQDNNRVGFYLLPKVEREPSPPTPRRLQHRLSVISEVTEDSSNSSTPASSPVRNISRSWRYSPEKSDNSRSPSPKRSSSPTVFQEDRNIYISTTGRGHGHQNKSINRCHSANSYIFIICLKFLGHPILKRITFMQATILVYVVTLHIICHKPIRFLTPG